eukprot:CAMPEP_0183308062 /NCGR_PEP_ID=MMETSP0160_2-20130417/19719_1 /TAXON_ID=2839 ORGANISM="Odontella Sinensis, Strain Grunow 1884" /NCGR_SAMPLE_ID=MMETSP0160_2 /ASSEMBLY_ACC=CAM_ASM_000250 /LENGTH=522 /DNA_ID=CAMNT_0025471807 /DNA_START=199 /DNA_END=1767 /DNA_ORIENTATION=-
MEVEPKAATDDAPKSFEDASESYRDLLSRLRTVTQLQRASAVLGYDSTVHMPPAAAAARGAQQAALASVTHEKATDAALKTLIESAESDLADFREEEGAKEAQRILELTRDSYEKNARVPAQLEAKKASLTSSAYAAWVQARKDSDFTSFEPILRDCFETASAIAEARRGDKDISLYTQMLDEFETGMSAERIDHIFDQIQDALVPLISKVLSSESKPSTSALKGNFPVPAQEAVNRDIVTSLGFDTTYGRIDVSVHPFTTSFSPSDVRITSRFSDDEWYQGLAGTVHEGGHAMYEQSLGDSGLEIDSALSMGAHESQSLFWERHVGLSTSFWTWAAPKLKKAFGEDFCYSPEQIYGAVNAVSPSLIRVEADELTYPLHVILRYKIERDIVEGNMDVKAIPERWNAEMKEMLGVDVPSDAQGCLQDVHWSALAIGYFPTYLIGSATAAQLAHYCQRDIPDFYEKIENGEFGEIKSWLTDKVHRHGKRYPSLDEMLEDQLGEKLNPKYFISYLTEKYSSLYQC